MRVQRRSAAVACVMLASIAAPVHAGIFNLTWTRSDGYFTPYYYPPTPHPQTTILRGFCYDFKVNGDFIDFTEKVTSTNDINSLAKTGSKNGTQNSVNGRGMGQITVHFCVGAGATFGNKTIRILNVGGGEFDRLVVNVVRGGKITGFTPTTARVNVPFQFTISGTDLQDATIEGPGLTHVNDPSDLNTSATRRFTLVLDASAGNQTHASTIFLRRISPPGGQPVTDPGMIRDAHGSSAMIIQVSGSSPVTGTIPAHPIPTIGPAPAVTGSSIGDLVLTAAGRSLRRLDTHGKIDEAFCQGFAVPAAGGATEKDITVPLWGLAVTNPHSGDFTGGGTVTLTGPVPAPAPITLGPIAAGRAITVPFTRPTSVTRAILILPTTSAAIKRTYGATALGCYQAALRATDSRNWTDPPFHLALIDPTTGTAIHSISF
jgi:hypothetical protein